jgi:hypothetical protein
MFGDKGITGLKKKSIYVSRICKNSQQDAEESKREEKTEIEERTKIEKAWFQLLVIMSSRLWSLFNRLFMSVPSCDVLCNKVWNSP